MVIPKQYPYLLEVLVKKSGYENDQGDWVEGTDVWTPKGKCRIEAAPKNAYRTGEDGSIIYYTSVIYTPLPKLDLKEADQIRVTIGTDVKNLEVKFFDGGSQMNNRIWV